MPFLNVGSPGANNRYFDPKYVDPVTLAARVKANQNLGILGGLKQFLTFAGTAGLSSANLLNNGSSPNGSQNPMEVPQITNGGVPNINLGGTVNTGISAILQAILNQKAPGTGSGGSNDWLKYLLPILAGVAGGLENRSQKTTSTTTPQISDNLKPLQSSVVDNYMKLLGEDPDLKGYGATQTQDLNHLADLQRRNALETYASHGVSGPAVATGLNSIDNNRFSQVAKLRQSLPLLSRQLKMDTLSGAGGFFNSSPRGLTQESNTSGNVLGGALSGGTELLAYLYGLGKI